MAAASAFFGKGGICCSGKCCSLFLGVIATLLAFVSTIILAVNDYNWSEQLGPTMSPLTCKAAILSLYTAAAAKNTANGYANTANGYANSYGSRQLVGYDDMVDPCELAKKAVICAGVSFAFALFGSISWCCIDVKASTTNPRNATEMAAMGVAAPPVQAAVASPQTFNVICPQGSLPGSKLSVVAPNGQSLEILVPANVQGGQQFAVAMPPATAPASAVAIAVGEVADGATESI
jgi:hypothetical protein